jgi:AraC family ethanolamine operon transcriptional activator
VVRISQHASCDVDDQAQALEGWKQSYEQLGRGRFSGQTRQLLMDDGMLLRESTNLPLREEIAPPPDHWVFAMPEVMHPDTRFAGRTLQGSSLIPLLPGQEYELLATGTLDLVAVSVHRRVVESLDVALQDWLYTLRGACTVALLPRAAAAALSLLQQAVAQAEAFACNAAGADQCQLLTAVVSGLVCLGAKSSKAASLDAVPRRAQARQQVVRRAVEFMHAHLQQDIRAADICAAAYASQRTLQYCFEECLRVTPLAYLRAYYERHIFFCLNEAQERRGLLRAARRAGRLRPLQVAGEGRGPVRPGQGAGQQGRLPGPLRGRAGGRGLPGGRLVQLRGRERHRRDRRIAPEERPGGRAPAHAAEPRPLSASRSQSMNAPPNACLTGAAGRIEAVIDDPRSPMARPRGVAVVAHPHPLFGGTMDNKVVQTLARAFVPAAGARCASTSAASAPPKVCTTRAAARCRTCWPSCRRRPRRKACRWPWPGFRSARSSPATPCRRCGRRGRSRSWCWSAPPRRASGGRRCRPKRTTARWSCMANWTTPCRWQSVMDWARPQSLPVTVVPGGGHFFHGQLPLLKNLVMRHLRA